MADCEKIKISILDKEPINVNILEDKEISIKLDESAPAPTYFIDLYDTPKKYAGEGGKFVKVKTDETGMEFVDTSQIVNWDDIEGNQSDVNVSGFTNDAGYLTTFIEADPIWISEKDNYYTKTEIDSEGFIKEETDPVFTGWDKSTGISITESQISDFGTYQKTSEKGQANGYAGLDQGGKVSLQHLPSTLLKYMGVWNPVTNTPELISPDITKVGQVYNVGAEGSRFGYDWKLGDWAIYNESGIIELSKNSDDVVQVNGQTGSVELDLTDMNDVDDSLKAEGKFLVVDNQGEHVYTEIDESKWEVDGTGYIKPKGVDKVKAENIEGIPTNSDFNLSDLSDVDATSKSTNKILQVDVSGKHIYTDIPDTSKWEADGTGYIKPVDGGKVKAEHIDGIDTSGLIPYTGANQDIDLGDNKLTLFGEDFYSSSVEVPATAPKLTRQTGGDMYGRVQYYTVTYYTAEGETTNGPISTVTTTSTYNKVLLTNIPISSDPRVIGRRIYRTLTATLPQSFYLLADIPDNVQTSYTDTIKIPGGNSWSSIPDTLNYYKLPKIKVGVKGLEINGKSNGNSIVVNSNLQNSADSIVIGQDSGTSPSNIDSSVIIGYDGGKMTTGKLDGSIIIGNNAGGTGGITKDIRGLVSIGDGAGGNANYAVIIGYDAGNAHKPGVNSYSTIVGTNAGKGSTASSTANSVTAFGYLALRDITSGNYNTAIGHGALRNTTSQGNQIAIGTEAGTYIPSEGLIAINNYLRYDGARALRESFLIGKGTHNGNGQTALFNVDWLRVNRDDGKIILGENSEVEIQKDGDDLLLNSESGITKTSSDLEVGGDITGVHKAADGTAAVADGTYTMGIGGTSNGTITIKDGIITAIQEAVA